MRSNHPLFRAVLMAAVCTTGWALAQDVPVALRRFGTPMQATELDAYRGGFDLVKNDTQLSGTVASNAAVNVLSGSNSIADGAFANASGLPMVIQNSGSNVLIQNATVVNVQLK